MVLNQAITSWHTEVPLCDHVKLDEPKEWTPDNLL